MDFRRDYRIVTDDPARCQPVLVTVFSVPR